MGAQDRRTPLVAFGLVAAAVALGMWLFGLGPNLRLEAERAELARWLQDYAELVERREGPFRPGDLDDGSTGLVDRIFELQADVTGAPAAMADVTEFGFGVDGQGSFFVTYSGRLGSCTYTATGGPAWSDDELTLVPVE